MRFSYIQTVHPELQELVRENFRLARRRWPVAVNNMLLKRLQTHTEEFLFSLVKGDLALFDSGWYVTHSGLLRLACREKCRGIHVEPVAAFCDRSTANFTFKATVYPSFASSGFVGFGDADPTNVSPMVLGAEMRVAETRAVNRALRKAYGIGLCSVEELSANTQSGQRTSTPGKLPPQPSDGSGPRRRKVRDQLCQIIRQHQLDPNLVKSYAVDFCGVKSLKEATREQVETFVKELSEWAVKDRNALLSQLNSYLSSKEGAA